MSTPIQQVVAKLDLPVHERLDGFFTGDFQNLFHGFGSELGETRAYETGDDVRRIDWNVTARLQKPHIRQTIADTTMTAWLVVDQSPRLRFGTADYLKSDIVLAACAAFSLLISNSGNNLGVLFARGENTKILPPKNSTKHAAEVVRQLHDFQATDGIGITDLAAQLTVLQSVCRQKSLVILISDFLVSSGWQKQLSALRKQHEIIAVQICDERDFVLPNVGTAVFQDPATGNQVEIATQQASVRESFAQAALQRQAELERFFTKNRLDHLQLSTTQDWFSDLLAFLKRRTVRKQARR